MRKALKITSVSLLAVTVLSGCGNSNNNGNASSSDNASTSSTANTNTSANAAEKVTLTVAHYMVEKPKVDTFKKLTDKFTEMNPNVSFDIQVMPVDKYSDNIKMKINGGDSPDIIFGRPAGMVEMTKAGAFLDVTNEAFVKRFDPAYIPNVSYEGKVYGLPVDLMTNAVIYNKDLFKQAGVEVPKTFSEPVEGSRDVEIQRHYPVRGLLEGWRFLYELHVAGYVGIIAGTESGLCGFDYVRTEEVLGYSRLQRLSAAREPA